jgi:hypothetical protein
VVRRTGHVAAAPPTSEMNSRRLMSDMGPLLELVRAGPNSDYCRWLWRAQMWRRRFLRQFGTKRLELRGFWLINQVESFREGAGSCAPMIARET